MVKLLRSFQVLTLSCSLLATPYAFAVDAEHDALPKEPEAVAGAHEEGGGATPEHESEPVATETSPADEHAHEVTPIEKKKVKKKTKHKKKPVKKKHHAKKKKVKKQEVNNAPEAEGPPTE